MVLLVYINTLMNILKSKDKYKHSVMHIEIKWRSLKLENENKN